MNKQNPKLQITSPKNNTTDLLNLQINKLPKLRERLLTNYDKKNETNTEEKSEYKNPKRDVSKFSDKPLALNEKTKDTVRELAKRKAISHKLKETVSDDQSSSKHDLAACRSELDLQVQFLKAKFSPRVPKNGKIPAEKSGNDLSVNQSNSFLKSASCQKNSESKLRSTNSPFLSAESPIQNFKTAEEKAFLLEKDLERTIQDNMNLKTLLSQSTSAISKLREEKESLYVLLSQSSEHQGVLQETLKKNQVLLEDIELKTSDNDMLKENIKRNDQLKKSLNEALKELEANLDTEKAKNSQLTKTIENLQNDLLGVKENLNKEIEINSQLKHFETAFKLLQESFNTLSQEHKDLKSQNSETNDSLKSLQNSLSNLKLSFREKEDEYGKMIQNLMDQLQSEKSRKHETSKLKRALTFKESESLTSIQEEASRYQNPSTEPDKEKQEYIEEIEKLKRNSTYFSFLIKNKDEIIHILEEENSRMKLTIQNSAFVFSADTLKVLKEFVRSWMICHRCSEGVAMYLVVPCRHLLCSKCEPVAKECPKCSKGFAEIRLFSEFNKVRDISMILSRVNI